MLDTQVFRLRTVLHVVLLLSSSSTAFAQSDSTWIPSVAPGARIRVALADTSKGRILRGTYAAALGDSLRVLLAPGLSMVVPTHEVLCIDQSLGRPRWTFLAIGTVGGAVLGGLIGSWHGERSDPGGLGGLVGFVAGVLLGAPIGGVTGAIVGGIGVVFGGVDLARDQLSAGEYVSTVATNALIGGAIGYLLAPKGWIPVPLQR